ncbi:MAG: hypothetical protein E5Y06_31535 [Mesorhizobium sp.]|uniref:hypothetical protein n=1 Tax=Mesorhizobium sp. TaxID=1871066 RepID=UPI001200331F|nr:hypothetical protein [Mesorhizobium sp.]TIN90658.1 MAG: hypothetical protein E5Y06_31535 [Mesorhizobium sp.]TJU93992.1 MAG: hypothetical protein E5Y08_31900 [Mesorhizobium sp.]
MVQVNTDPGANWRSWSKVEWNDALVRAVFLRRPAGTIIRRIDTTQSWMAQIAGANVSQGEAVRDAFLSVFRGFHLSARALFSPARLTRGWSSTSTHLPFFAELYLSLIVASADERTADLGRYRERLAELTGIGAGALIGHELPDLWRKAALWSTSTSAVDVARLVLPSPGNEAIIGIAKRLAFPRYLDQQRLATLIARTGLDDRAPVADLLDVLRAELAGFSDHFQAEFREFRERYQRDPLDAARTPFWQALQEISWARGEVYTDGMLDLELDPSDPHDARLTVLATGTLPTLDDWIRFDDPSFVPGMCALARADNRAGRIIEALQRDVVVDGPTAKLQARRLRLGLRTGLLAFTRQDLDRWTLAEQLATDDDTWLLARHDIAPRLGEALRTRAGHPLYLAALPGSHAWKLVGPLPVTYATQALLAGLAGTRLFDARMPSARIDLSGSVMQPGGVYLRRPLLPFARVDLADSCTFHAIALDGASLSDGAMVGRGEATFALPANVVTQDIAQLRIDAHGTEGLVASRTIEVVGRCTAERTVPLSRPEHWLVDGDSGNLIALAQPSPAVQVPTLAAPPCLRVGSDPVAPSRQIPAADLSSDLVEMLVAILSRRQVLPARRALELILDWHGGSPSEGWAILATLVENHLVRLVSPRHWRGLGLAAIAPEGWLVARPNGCRARIIGTLGELQRLRLADKAAQLGVPVTVHIGNPAGSVGATEFIAPDAAIAEQILASVGIAVCRAEPPHPIAPLGYLPLSVADPPTGFRSRWWERANGTFGDDRRDDLVALELRSFDRRRDLFVLTTPERRFVTESRRGALLAWAIAYDGKVGTFTSDGSISLSRPYLALPPSVAWTALVLGGGIVTRGFSGELVYAAGGARVLVDQLEAWCQVIPSRSAGPTDLVRALTREPRHTAVAIALGRHALSLTDRRRSAGW